jgi:signal transduction histidine kinase
MHSSPDSRSAAHPSEPRARETAPAGHAPAPAPSANHSTADVLAGMAHDLRTPLNAIMGYARLVADGMYGPVTADQADVLARVQRANQHLLELINDLLCYARLETDDVTLHIQPLTVQAALAPARALIEPELQAKGLVYVERSGADGMRMNADRERVTEILVNLLMHVIAHTDSGSVTLECNATQETVGIRIRDAGSDMPPECVEDVFDPLVQARASPSGRARATGLGLALSRRLARAMHGDLTLACEPGQGSTFTLHLPRAAH